MTVQDDECGAFLEDDDAILQKIFVTLAARVTADPYAWDGGYAMQLRGLARGLRAMAATHDLAVNLSRRDFGWHFLKCGEPNNVLETKRGLSDLGLGPIAALFCEAYEIVRPYWPEIRSSGDHVECLQREGQMDRIRELTREAAKIDQAGGERVSGSAIYAAWIRYARVHPKSVFPA